MKKEDRNRNWIALGLSVIAILLWLCKYEPVTWTLFDSMIAFLSFVVGALAVMVGYNIFGLKNDLKNEIEEKLQDISDHHDTPATHGYEIKKYSRYKAIYLHDA